jgi:hypothetical protein
MDILSATTKINLALTMFGLVKIPILFSCRPKVIELNDDRCVVKIPLNRRTKNHENCMYIAALTVGADIAGGLIAINLVRESGRNARFLFKDFNAKYLKRAEGDVYFTCNDGPLLRQLVENASKTGIRQNQEVKVVATVPDKFGEQPVAEFKLTLSIKESKTAA